jgi:hypothetical protein
MAGTSIEDYKEPENPRPNVVWRRQQGPVCSVCELYSSQVRAHKVILRSAMIVDVKT